MASGKALLGTTADAPKVRRVPLEIREHTVRSSDVLQEPLERSRLDAAVPDPPPSGTVSEALNTTYKQDQFELGIRDVLVFIVLQCPWWCTGAQMRRCRWVRRRTGDHKLFVRILTRFNLSEARLLHGPGASPFKWPTG